MSRPPLNQTVVVDAALALLDEVGLDGLTVRRLAAELGVQSPALYWHFRNKQELVDGMATAILLATGMGPPSDGESWQDWLVRRGHSYRDQLLAHRDGARVIVAARNLGAAVLNEYEGELASMITFGFTRLQAHRTIAVVSNFTTGSALEEQAARPDDRGHERATSIFEHGIRVIVAGTQALLAVDAS